MSHMPPNSHRKIVLLGDSTLDNDHWVTTKKGTVTEQLRLKLSDQAFVLNLAMDGFKTADVLKGAKKDIGVSDSKHTDEFFNPLLELMEIAEYEQPTDIVLSVGGNDVRECLSELIFSPPESRIDELNALLKTLQDNTLQIIDELKKACPNSNIIITLLYTPYIKSDIYFIYYLMQQFAENKALKKDCLTYLDIFFYKCFGRSQNVEDQSIIQLYKIMEAAYSPIIEYAKTLKIPILDLASTFDYTDENLYTAQIEPSGEGAALMAELLSHIITHHDFEHDSMIYSKPGCTEGPIIATKNTQSWKPRHLSIDDPNAHVFFHAEYRRQLTRDKSKWYGIYGWFAKSHVDPKATMDELIQHAAQGGQRSLKVMQHLGWMR